MNEDNKQKTLDAILQNPSLVKTFIKSDRLPFLKVSVGMITDAIDIVEHSTNFEKGEKAALSKSLKYTFHVLEAMLEIEQDYRGWLVEQEHE